MSSSQDYTVGWICAITTEYVAACVSLDEEHPGLESVDPNDNNVYRLGKMGEHNVVIASLPKGEYGISSAATVARDMLRTFSNIRICLMVGIGGGAPTSKHDIRLGDIVVSIPGNGSAGVYQYDFGKAQQNREFVNTGHLNQTPPLLRAAVGDLEADYEVNGHQIKEVVDDTLRQKPRLRKRFGSPGFDEDRLFKPDLVHRAESDDCVKDCGKDASKFILRSERTDEDDDPAIHYGTIASSNTLMKDAMLRDELVKEKDILCFEMEAAGLMNHFPCLVIRGICDYSDSHKNKVWQGYAAIAAATYAKDLLGRIVPSRVEAERKIGEAMNEINYKLDGLMNKADKVDNTLQTSRKEYLSDKLHSWLSPSDPSTNFHKAIARRHQGTGQWFIQKDFVQWQTEHNSFLWLYGMPGCGKTVLSTTIIEELETGISILGTLSPRTVLYFYFDFSDVGKQSLEQALRTLHSQLYRQVENCRNNLDTLHAFCRAKNRQPSVQELCETFESMVRGAGEVYIVLDALDECTNRGKSRANGGLLAWLQDLQHAKELNVHILITSRPEQDIQAFMNKLVDKQDSISIQDSLVARDIQSYVHETITTDQDLNRWKDRPDIQEQIEKVLTEKAGGMFRWVYCQLESLKDCLLLPALEEALQSLPRTLDETYARILENVSPSNRHYTVRILQVLAYSDRPLRIEEMTDFIIVNPQAEPYFKPTERMPKPEEISRYCTTLVSVVDRWDPRKESDSGKELQLSHLSVKEYLTSNRIGGLFATEFDEEHASTTIAKVSLAYLHGLDFNTSLDELKKQYPLAKYCAEKWTSYAATSRCEDNILQLLIRGFFLVDGNHAACIRLHNPDISWNEKDEEAIPLRPIYYASLCGLTWAVEMLLKGGADINAQSGTYGNALQAASLKGNADTVKMLLEGGAEINTQGGNYGNALQAASFHGNAEIVKMLLEGGAEINTQGGHYGNALQAASFDGNAEIVKMLLEGGAEINAQSGNYGNALQTASIEGNAEIVKMLLEGGAEINAQGGIYGNALQAASLKGNADTVKMLLEGGAEINAQGGNYGNALQAASRDGNAEIVKMLLEGGAEINARGGNYGNALQAASRDGNAEIVEILTACGAITMD